MKTTTTAAQTIAYSYMRFSDPTQGKGDSQRRQDDPVQAYCKAEGLVLSDRRLRDPGVSAFRGRNHKKGDLSKFLALCECGTVKPGEVLIVECLDRLSRQEVMDHLQLFLRILSTGVKIVTLMDRKSYTLESCNKNPMDLMYSILIMMRANEESETKARRSTASWEHKHELAAESGKPATAKCPYWLRLGRAGYELVAERATAMRRIVEMAEAGLGFMSISRKANAEKLPTTRRSKGWDVQTIKHLLQSRTLIGEYQPRRRVDGRLVNAGEPIENYYPALLSEAEFYRMRAVVDGRSTKVKGRTGRLTNLFGRILVDGHDGGTMVLRMNLNKSGRRYTYLVSSNAVKGLAGYNVFPYEPFEAAFLTWVQELDLVGMNPQDQTGRLDELQAKLGTITHKLQTINKAVMDDDGEPSEALLQMVRELDKQKKMVVKELEGENARRHGGTVDTSSIRNLVSQMGELPPAERFEVRAKLQAAIHSVVKYVRIYIHHEGMIRLAIAHVRMEGKRERIFGVRVERGQRPVTYSDSVLWRRVADPTPEMSAQLIAGIAANMLAAGTVEGMAKTWNEAGEVAVPVLL